MSRSQINLRIPPDEKREPQDEASRYGISMSALVRINNLQARENREREAIKRGAYPTMQVSRTTGVAVGEWRARGARKSLESPKACFTKPSRASGRRSRDEGPQQSWRGAAPHRT